MDSLRTLPLTHKFICTHILPSLRSWWMVASRPGPPQGSWIYSFAIQKCVPSMIHLFSSFCSGSSFPSFWFLFIITWPCPVSSNLKANKTSTILYTSSIYHCFFFLYADFWSHLQSVLILFAVHPIFQQIQFGFCHYKSTGTAYPKAVNDFLTVKASGLLVLSYLTSPGYLTSLSAFLFWDPLL